MSKIKCAVIGVGYLGKFHAQKFAMLTNAELVAVCDIDAETCARVAAEHGVQAVQDYRELLGKVDAVSIAVPTHLHYQVSKDFLESGAHVLVEKPITRTIEEAQELIALADKNKLLLQVGHLERFNSARLALQEYLDKPKFIESHRLAPFNPRGTDVNVVLELMIHDIDIIQNMVNSPIVHIDAQGAPVLTKFADIVNARIQFENDCVANVTASRVSFKTERKTRIFQMNSYISIDFHNKKFAVFRKGEGEMFPGIPDIISEEKVFENSDALLLEIIAFLDSIEHNKPAVVSGVDGFNALQTAIQITTLVGNNLAKLNNEEVA